MGGSVGSGRSRHVSRRTLLKAGAAGAAATALPLGGLMRLIAQGDVGNSPPVRSFTVPLPRPPLAVPSGTTPEGLPLYVFHEREAFVPILPGRPPTRIWGYEGITPGPTVSMRAGQKIVVRQVNELETGTTTHLHGGDTEAIYDGYPTSLVPPGTSFDYVYTGEDETATLWYHDHAIHETGFNVYQGLAGMFLVSDANERALPLPKGRFDVPLVIQDRLFDKNAQLVYPFDDDQHQVLQQGVFGDVFLVNGAPKPFMRVGRRKYRFRILNGSNARVLTLALSTGEAMTVIASEHQLFEHPIDTQTLHMTPSERYQVVIDFAKYPVGTKVVLRNQFEDDPGDPFDEALTRQIMRFDVVADVDDPSSVPADLAEQEPLGVPDVRRHWEFARKGGQWVINDKVWDENRVDAVIRDNTTERWTLENGGGGWIHPIHPHLVEFTILDRNGRPPEPYEVGHKDTVSLGPNDVVRIQFTVDEGKAGRYAYHCHNVEHEDDDMMTQIEFVL